MAAFGENIGMATKVEPNERSRQLTRMFFTMIGVWRGEYTYWNDREKAYVTGAGTLTFNGTPMPNVMTLDAITARPSGPPVHAFSTMVVQADGTSWRQMAFTETDGRIQDKVLTDYSYADDRNWTVDMLEVQQALGGVSAVIVRMVIENGRLDMRKFRKLDGGEAAARDFESRALFERVT